MTQGSALRATLGFGTESRWDSRRVEFESPHLSSNGAKSISTFVFPGGADLVLQRLIHKLKQRLRRRIVRQAEILVKFAVVGFLTVVPNEVSQSRRLCFVPTRSRRGCLRPGHVRRWQSDETERQRRASGIPAPSVVIVRRARPCPPCRESTQSADKTR